MTIKYVSYDKIWLQKARKTLKKMKKRCLTALSLFQKVYNKETNEEMHGRNIRSGQDSNQ